MPSYRIDETTISQGRGEIAEAIRCAQEVANKGAVVRLVNCGDMIRIWRNGYQDQRSLRRRHWQWETGGGYRSDERSRANSSVVGVAWVIDQDGALHYRIVGDRVVAPKSKYGTVGPPAFGLLPGEIGVIPRVVLVYPEFYLPPQPAEFQDCAARMARHLRAHPLDWETWLVLSDRHEEEERQDDADWCRRAALRAQLLCGAFSPDLA